MAAWAPPEASTATSGWTPPEANSWTPPEAVETPVGGVSVEETARMGVQEPLSVGDRSIAADVPEDLGNLSSFLQKAQPIGVTGEVPQRPQTYDTKAAYDSAQAEQVMKTPITKMEAAMTPLVKVIPNAAPLAPERIMSDEEALQRGVSPFRKPTITERVGAISQNVVADTVNSLTSPLGIATMGLGAAPKGLQKLVAAIFAGQAIKNTPEAISNVANAATPEERDQAITGLIENTGMAVLAGQHAASRPSAGGGTRPPSLPMDAQGNTIPRSMDVIVNQALQADAPLTAEAIRTAPEILQESIPKTEPPSVEKPQSQEPLPAPVTTEPTRAAVTPETPPDYTGGPGAMGPVEASEMQAQGATTGLKRATVDIDRLTRGEESIPTVERQREETLVRSAEDRIDADPAVAPTLVARIVDKGERAITEQDAATLLVERQRVMNERSQWEERLGRGEDVEIARERIQQAEENLNRLDQAQRAAGSTWGRVGHLYQRMIREDFTLEAMERKLRAKVERPLTEAERGKIKEQAAKIQELQTQVERGQHAETEALELQKVAQTYEATIRDLQGEIAGRPKFGKEIFDIARGIVNRWKSEADAVDVNIRDFLGSETGAAGDVRPGGRKMGEAPTPKSEFIRNVALKMRAQIGEKGLNFAEASAEMIAAFGEKIKPYLQPAWEQAQALIGKEKTDLEVKKAIRKGAVKTNPAEAKPADVLARAATEAAEKKPISHQTVYDLARAHINAGIHGENAVMKAVHADLVKLYPELTERQVRQAFSQYGEVKFPSKEADKVELRELRTLVRLQESIDRETAGLEALKSGPQRDKATQAIREKQRQLNDLLKRRERPATPEQLATRDEARKTALRNQIEDLDKQLRTGEKPPAGTKPMDSVAIEQLKAERDAMRSKLREIEESEKVRPSPEQQRESVQIKSAEKSIAELDRRLREGELEAKAKPSPEVSARVQQLRSERDAMREQLRAMQDEAKTRLSPEDKQVADLAKIRDRLNETLSGAREQTKAKDFNPLSRAAADLKAEILAMQELAAQVRRDAKPPVDRIGRETAAKVKALEAAIAEYDRKISSKDFASASKGEKGESAVVKVLRDVRDARRKMYEAAKKADKPVRSAEEIYNDRRLKDVKRQMEAVQKRIAAGDYTRPEKPAPIPKTKEVKEAEFQLAQEKKKFNEGLFKADLEKRSAGRKAFDTTREVFNTARAIQTSADLSAVLRQGGFIAIGHPLRAAKAIPSMLKSFLSERGEHAVNSEILARPNAPKYAESKLYLHDPNDLRLSKMEEAYMSRWANKIPGVSHSQRAYTTFLNRLRADSFDAMTEAMGREPLPAEAQAIANFINVATGRGTLAQAGAAAVNLNTFLFSPRYLSSRFELLAGQPFYKGTAATRVAIAKEYARTLGGLAVIYTLGKLAGATIESDPKDSDFGKLKFGNTRVDLMMGLAQVTTFEARLGSVLSKFAKGEKIKPGEGDFLARFIRSKLAPVPASVIDAATGKDIVGQPVTRTSAATRLVKPLVIDDIVKTMEEQGIERGTAISLLIILGMSSQTYQRKGERPALIEPDEP